MFVPCLNQGDLLTLALAMTTPDLPMLERETCLSKVRNFSSGTYLGKKNCVRLHSNAFEFECFFL